MPLLEDSAGELEGMLVERGDRLSRANVFSGFLIDLPIKELAQSRSQIEHLVQAELLPIALDHCDRPSMPEIYPSSALLEFS
ncbi:MAG: hypothetical protein HY785_11690 [Oscillatoriophycideae cyanobacterium NC_groundwater_1537_Pr4_S-0.65um_50_18]|nr:hypothetical protein [Oscillatoriophycideae cyanobacterium NC_groundwater_1537_Pr4_S-0.65um_50_18]